MPGIMYIAKDELELRLQSFREAFSPQELEAFCSTSLPNMKVAIMRIQQDQERVREMMAFGRIQKFLDCMEQYEKVLGTLVDLSKAAELMAFVWGPMLFFMKVNICHHCSRRGWC